MRGEGNGPSYIEATPCCPRTFGRLQISSVTHNAFSEPGAQSLSLSVAQQTTNSLRTTIGADLASSIGRGNENKLDLAVRLGCQHEFADTSRPVAAAMVVVACKSTTQIYLRYDGSIGGGTDNHAVKARRSHELVTSRSF